MYTKQFFVFIVLLILFSACGNRKFVMAHKAQLEDHFIEDGDYRLHYVTIGSPSNPPLLMIHGAPSNWKAYKNFLTDTVMYNHFQLISVDRLGYGESTSGKQKVVASIEKQAEEIEKTLLCNLSGEKAIIIGRSYGAPIAAKIAANHPEKVLKLILAAPVIDPNHEKYFWFAYAARTWLVKPFLPREYATATDEKFAHSSELKKMIQDWKKIICSVTVIQGGKDEIGDKVNLRFSHRMLNKLKSKFIFIPNAGHYITDEHYDLVKKEVFAANLEDNFIRK